MRLPIVLVAPMVVISYLFIAPEAEADCTSSAGTTICSQGDVRGANTGQGPGSGPSVPYPCDYDWNCDQWGWDWDVNVDWNPGGGIGAPGRPGNRPGAGRPSTGGGRGGRR
ncbi:hypothetical protein Mycch_1245 [Mycolicibacterium chubuense NBB4]|uniref:Pilin n=1 Tax=Mycolicibacterium chubuense (strain NBB4) TaxID=710421 RepID=I4BFJ6_MYCCN|nr:hypothetical protein [Mycolicibacterium chubuense]AFM16053.1 hypothetical protein Mycch_1245 [Mycolicibacterium chubuense NBB4]